MVSSTSLNPRCPPFEPPVCRCGKSFVKFKEVSVSSFVELFEQVNTSNHYNFQLCRIPLPNSKLKFSVWYTKLRNYSDKVICDYLQFGFPIDFDNSIELKSDVGRNHKGARDFPEFINSYFNSECSQLRIVGPFHNNPLSVPLVISPLNSVPKSESEERRVIVDLSWPHGHAVNNGISKDKYLSEPIDLRYASVEDVCNMVLSIGAGALIYKRDLKQAYRQIPVDPRDYQYLGYKWGDMMFFDTVLAMGQRNAAMACSRTTRAVMHLHNKVGFHGTSYLDDLIGVSPPSEGQVAFESLGVLLDELGLVENHKKACSPSSVQTVLGVQIDTVALTIGVTPERIVELLELFQTWENKRKASKHDLQSLIGKLCFVTKCVRQSRTFLNRMLDTLRSCKPGSTELSVSFRKDIAWWKKFMEKFNGVWFIPSTIWSEPDVYLSTDSCLRGCGGIAHNEYFHSSYPEFILKQDLPIHQLELLAVLVGVRLWGKRYAGQKVQIYCDNESAVTVINSSRTKDKFMATCLRELWLNVCCHEFELRAVHLPGEENRLADWLSRWEVNEIYSLKFNEFLVQEKEVYHELRVQSELFKFSSDL